MPTWCNQSLVVLALYCLNAVLFKVHVDLI